MFEMQFKAIHFGLKKVIPFVGYIPAATLDELIELISGSRIIELVLWKRMTKYYGFGETDDTIFWFWEILNVFDEDRKKNVLQYWTGFRRLPSPDQNLDGEYKNTFYIVQLDDNTNHDVRTCFRQINIPACSKESVESLLEHFAIDESGKFQIFKN